jgi:Uri superfamily endonuclease
MVQIGNLGNFTFPPGDYVYVGSALGTGGLRARIQRLLRPDRRFHWHIDWLVAEIPIVGSWYVSCDQRLECLWAQALKDIPQIIIPASGFGSSDCRARGSSCPAHLLLSKVEINITELAQVFDTANGLCQERVSYFSIQRDPSSSFA